MNNNTQGVSIPITVAMEGQQQAFGGIESLLTALTQIAKTTESINGKMDGLGQNISDNMDKAGKKTESLLDKFAKIGLAIDGVKSIVGQIAPIFEAGLSREKSDNMFGILLGTPEQGKAYAKELRDSVAGQLYGMDVVGGVAQQMMSFGISANDTKPILQALGDIAGGDEQKMESLGLAFAQMSSTGKLMGQDLMQMINAGFHPLEQMSQTTGKSIGELKDEMAKGAISADMVREAFIGATEEGGKFHGIARAQMGGLSGVLKQINQQWEEVKISIYEALAPLAQSILPPIISMMKRLVDFLKSPAFPFFATVFGSIALAMKTYGIYTEIASKWTTIMTAKQWLLNLAMDANPIGLVVAAIAALIAGITVCIKKYDEWGAALSFVLGPFGILINIIESFKRHWDSIVEAFNSDGIIAGIKRIGQVLLDAMLMPLQQLLEVMSNIPGLGGLAGKGANSIANLRKSLNLASGIVPGKEGASTMGGENGNATAKQNALTSSTSSATKGVNSATAGGTRNTAVNISLGSLVHQITYQGGIKENSAQTTQELQEALLRVLYAAESSTN